MYITNVVNRLNYYQTQFSFSVNRDRQIAKYLKYFCYMQINTKRLRKISRDQPTWSADQLEGYWPRSGSNIYAVVSMWAHYECSVQSMFMIFKLRVER